LHFLKFDNQQFRATGSGNCIYHRLALNFSLCEYVLSLSPLLMSSFKSLQLFVYSHYRRAYPVSIPLF
jgi:hypothetical protein